MAIKVYISKANTSPPARAVQMALERLEVPYDVIEIDVLSGENKKESFLKLNPQHTVPVIQDGDFTLWDSHAILAYLVGKYAKDDSLLPKDVKKRAVVDQRLHLDSNLLFPTLLSTFRPIFYGGEKSYRNENVAKVRELYDIVEILLGDKPWIAGDQLTIADYSCGTTFGLLKMMVEFKGKYPKVEAWYDRFTKLPYFEKVNATGMAVMENILAPYKIQ